MHTYAKECADTETEYVYLIGQAKRDSAKLFQKTEKKASYDNLLVILDSSRIHQAIGVR